MTYLAQILGNTLLGLVSNQTVARVGQMDKTLRDQSQRKNFK